MSLVTDPDSVVVVARVETDPDLAAEVGREGSTPDFAPRSRQRTQSSYSDDGGSQAGQAWERLGDHGVKGESPRHLWAFWALSPLLPAFVVGVAMAGVFGRALV